MKHATELQNSQTQINQLEGLSVCPSLLHSSLDDLLCDVCV